MQVTETKYNAIARTLNLFGLNPTYVQSLSPEDCKQMLEQISQEYIEKEKLDERVVVIDFEEHLVWSRIFYPDGSNIIFPNKEDQDRYRNELDDFISSFSIEENENLEEQLTFLKIVKGIREKFSETEVKTEEAD